MWKAGMPSPNPKGRPKGAKAKQPALTMSQKRELIDSLYARAARGDTTAMDELFWFWQMQELQSGARA